MHPENRNFKVWLFLDEIQNVAKWEKAIRFFADRLNVQVYITGSSSKLLSKEIATQLRGRTITFEVLPFSFNEFLKVKNFKVSKYISSRERSILLNLLEEYMLYGGYPEVVLEPEHRMRILKEIWDVTISRDIIERWKIKNIKVLRLLIRAILESKEFSVHKFYNYLKTLGLKISKNTLYNYLEYLQDSLVVYFLRRYSKTYKEVEASRPKVYMVDTGLYLGREEKGRLFENLVFLELKRRGYEVFYWRDERGKEVDFLIVENYRPIKLIQACYELTFENLKREIDPLLKASKQLNCNSLEILTWSQQRTIEVNNRKIKVIPLWKWILQPYFS